MSEDKSKDVQPAQEKTDKELVYFLFDKLYEQKLDSERAWNRTFLVLLLGSLGLITFSAGVVSVSQFELGGFSFSPATAILLIGGSAVVALFQTHFWNLSYFGSRLDDQIRGLTKYLGLDPDTSVGAHLLMGLPDIRAGMVFSLARRGRAGIINLIPIALAGLLAQLLSFFAEGAALWKLVVLYGWTWWGVLAYLFIFTLSGIYFVIEYVSYLKEYGIPLMRSYFRQSKTSKSNGVVRK